MATYQYYPFLQFNARTIPSTWHSNHSPLAQQAPGNTSSETAQPAQWRHSYLLRNYTGTPPYWPWIWRCTSGTAGLDPRMSRDACLSRGRWACWWFRRRSRRTRPWCRGTARRSRASALGLGCRLWRWRRILGRVLLCSICIVVVVSLEF